MKFSELQRLQRMEGITVLSADERIEQLEARLRTITKERDALRIKVNEMERQEPVAWLHETRRDSDVVTDAVKHVWGKVAVGAMAAYSIPLGILPDAQGEEK